MAAKKKRTMEDEDIAQELFLENDSDSDQDETIRQHTVD
jgi:hypothetical protein